METQPSYVVMLSLQEMALSRIAITLWNQPDILALIGKLEFRPLDWRKREWREAVECMVTDRISKLQLPEPLMQKMIQILKPIGSQILRWKFSHQVHLCDNDEKLDAPFLKKLRWTCTGMVDNRKTAEELVLSDLINNVKRYKLACLYCLEDYIPEFWEELPEEMKTYFYKEDTSQIVEPPLHFCWPYILKGEESKLDNVRRSVIRTLEENIVPPRIRFHQYAFDHSSITGNKTAAEYFFQKLSHEEREACLFRAAPVVVKLRNQRYRHAFTHENFSVVLCYLLSQMSPERQIQIVRVLPPFDLLRCFMAWPWQNLFFDIADVVWTFIPEIQYNVLLSEMYWTMNDSGYYLPNLLQNLFQRSPIFFGKIFIEEDRIGLFFEQFFDNRDTGTIRVIFRSVDAIDKVKILFNPYLLKLFYQCSISEDRWEMLEMCIREAALSKENKDKLKECFMGFQSSSKWRRFCEFLDETDSNAESKRSSEEEALSEAKKLCCEKEENSTV